MKPKSGVEVFNEIHKIANSGDASNDMLMEKIIAVLEENRHLLREETK